MRTLARLLLLLITLAATPSLAAADDVPITCNLVDLQSASRLLGGTVETPTFDPIVVCAGLCPGRRVPACAFAVTGQDGGVTQMSIDLAFAPFEGVRDLRKLMHTLWEQNTALGDIADLPWPNGNALWFFQPPDRASLDVFIGAPSDVCADLRISLTGTMGREKARTVIAQLMHPTVVRLIHATAAELAWPASAKPQDRPGACLARFRSG